MGLPQLKGRVLERKHDLLAAPASGGGPRPTAGAVDGLGGPRPTAGAVDGLGAGVPVGAAQRGLQHRRPPVAWRLVRALELRHRFPLRLRGQGLGGGQGRLPLPPEVPREAAAQSAQQQQPSEGGRRRHHPRDPGRADGGERVGGHDGDPAQAPDQAVPAEGAAGGVAVRALRGLRHAVLRRRVRGEGHHHRAGGGHRDLGHRGGVRQPHPPRPRGEAGPRGVRVARAAVAHRHDGHFGRELVARALQPRAVEDDPLDQLQRPDGLHVLRGQREAREVRGERVPRSGEGADREAPPAAAAAAGGVGVGVQAGGLGASGGPGGRERQAGDVVPQRDLRRSAAPGRRWLPQAAPQRLRRAPLGGYVAPQHRPVDPCHAGHGRSRQGLSPRELVVQAAHRQIVRTDRRHPQPHRSPETRRRLRNEPARVLPRSRVARSVRERQQELVIDRILGTGSEGHELQNGLDRVPRGAEQEPQVGHQIDAGQGLEGGAAVAGGAVDVGVFPLVGGPHQHADRRARDVPRDDHDVVPAFGVHTQPEQRVRGRRPREPDGVRDGAVVGPAADPHHVLPEGGQGQLLRGLRPQLRAPRRGRGRRHRERAVGAVGPEVEQDGAVPDHRHHNFLIAGKRDQDRGGGPRPGVGAPPAGRQRHLRGPRGVEGGRRVRAPRDAPEQARGGVLQEGQAPPEGRVGAVHHPAPVIRPLAAPRAREPGLGQHVHRDVVLAQHHAPVVRLVADSDVHREGVGRQAAGGNHEAHLRHQRGPRGHRLRPFVLRGEQIVAGGDANVLGDRVEVRDVVRPNQRHPPDLE